MSSLFGLIGILFAVVVGLIVLLVLFVVIFGKRIDRLWEYEAKFRNELGQEFGEFEIEMSKVGKETTHTLKGELRVRHESLKVGQMVEVFIDDRIVLGGATDVNGQVLLDQAGLLVTQFEPVAGQMCRIVIDADERWQAELQID